MKNKVEVQEVKSNLKDRRSFLKLSGLALAGTGLLLAGCSDDDNNNNNNDNDQNNDQRPGIRNGKFDLGGGDLGILTYAYALEQLEADFYTQVVNHSNFNATFSNQEEREILIDLYKHEVIHREFFRAALTGALNGDTSRLLPNLSFSYASVNFSNRNSVLNTAMALEDTGVAAYNGVGKFLQSSEYLLLAGKIVSVEARHASAIRDVLFPNSMSTGFAGDDTVDPVTGLGRADKPSVIIPAVLELDFIQTEFTAEFLTKL